ncbi:fasciclin domain family protein [Colletotrichum tofieldiae]|nr:fasciclin domain family protein [Colletotrichum tofieldiae]
MAMTATKRKKASILRALRAVLYLSSLPLVVLFFISKWHNSNSQASQVSLPDVQTPPNQGSNLTVWEILSNDESVSRFAGIVGKLPDIVRGLSAPQAQFTVYAPGNEALDSFYFPPDPPPFFGLFLAGYHMGPGPVSPVRLRSAGTVSSFVNGDIFFTYKQRISIQQNHDEITFNHEAKYLPTDGALSSAMNGFVHHIDGILGLPNSTAHVIRTRPHLSKLREGFACTRLAESIYDTNLHVSQTLFAPTDVAFDRLGKKATKFLFSRWGRPYLRTLLKYHIVANQTLFSDMYWPHNGSDLVDFHRMGETDSHKFRLPTLLSNNYLTVESRKLRGRWHLRVVPSSDSRRSDEKEVVKVSVPDILTMDGVVHLVDAFILPPGPSPKPNVSWMSRLVAMFWHQDQSVEDLVDRLEPYIEEPEMSALAP